MSLFIPKVPFVLYSADGSVAISNLSNPNPFVNNVTFSFAASKSFTLTFGRLYGRVVIISGSGDVLDAQIKYKVTDGTSLGSSTTGIFVIGSPSSTQIGLTKSANSSVVTFTSGASLAGGTVVAVWADLPSSVTNMV